jgi:hypothetical protein
MEQSRPMKIESSLLSGEPYPKFVTYEYLPDDIKRALQEAVLEILGHNALSGDSVVYHILQYPWDSSGMQNYCTSDTVVNTLLALVRDGIVEMATLRDPSMPIEQWIPKYRRVGSRRALEAEEAIKASKCMKISKPWKQRDHDSTDWITGQGSFH